MPDRPKILIFTSQSEIPQIIGAHYLPQYENKSFDQVVLNSDQSLQAILSREKPHVILTTGKQEDWPQLFHADYDTRKKWLHFPEINAQNVEEVGEQTYHCFIYDMLYTDQHRNTIKISAFTCTYKTNEHHLQRLFNSLRNQTWTNWEWVVYDDSDDNGQTFERLKNLTNSDHRVVIYRGSERTGVIGHNKNLAAMMGSGEVLAEIDHDDELTEDCFQLLAKAYTDYPECGFYYTDCTELFENGQFIHYGDFFALGFGSYYQSTWNGVSYLISKAPPINAKTLRHIVGVPNHIRAWRKDIYHQIGGHNPKLYVADDYEIIVRSFLATKFLHIPKMCYLQYYRNPGESVINTQDIRRSEIQRLVRHIAHFYDKAIHDRILELGYEDWVWQGEYSNFYLIENPQNLNTVVRFNLTMDLWDN